MEFWTSKFDRKKAILIFRCFSHLQKRIFLPKKPQKRSEPLFFNKNSQRESCVVFLLLSLSLFPPLFHSKLNGTSKKTKKRRILTKSGQVQGRKKRKKRKNTTTITCSVCFPSNTSWKECSLFNFSISSFWSRFFFSHEFLFFSPSFFSLSTNTKKYGRTTNWKFFFLFFSLLFSLLFSLPFIILFIILLISITRRFRFPFPRYVTRQKTRSVNKHRGK